MTSQPTTQTIGSDGWTDQSRGPCQRAWEAWPVTVHRNQIACEEYGCLTTATERAHAGAVRAIDVRAWALTQGWATDGEGKDFCPDHSYGG
jgi:hypothetical protein